MPPSVQSDGAREDVFRVASNFGIRYPDVTMAGQNSKLSDFQAAVGLAVLDRLDDFVRCRHEVAERYQRALSGLPWVAQVQDPDLSPWQSYPVRVRDRDLAGLMQRALERGLELKRGYYLPLHRSTASRLYASGAARDGPLAVTGHWHLK